LGRDKRLEQLWDGISVNENTPELLTTFYRSRSTRQAPLGFEGPQPGAPRRLDPRAGSARGRPTHQTGRPAAWEGSSEQQSEANAPLLQEHPALRRRAGSLCPQLLQSHRTPVTGDRPNKLASGQNRNQYPVGRRDPEWTGSAAHMDAAAPRGQQ
jgi:hypothetical protein